MAYRPSYRRSRISMEDLEPNLTPVMNLMVVIIPLLLSSVQFIKISMIELNLPPASETPSTDPQKNELELDLAITITDQGFYLSSAAAILKTDAGPSIPKVNGEYDYQTLSQRLYEIKQKAAGLFKDSDSIVIQAEPQIEYQTVVSTMDAARAVTLHDKTIPLFPNIALSASVL